MCETIKTLFIQDQSTGLMFDILEIVLVAKLHLKHLSQCWVLGGKRSGKTFGMAYFQVNLALSEIQQGKWN